MRTYCKPKDVNIEDYTLIRRAVYLCCLGKLGRPEYRRLLVQTGRISRQELEADLACSDYNRIHQALDEVARQLQRDIKARDLQMEGLHPFQRRDGLSGKLRTLCKESPYQQICEYLVVEALQPLFRAKLLPCQYGSIPGRGQVSGARKIEQAVRRKCKADGTEAVKTDVHRAYPSTEVLMVLGLLRHDIGKNKPLLWLVYAVTANYPGGVLIIGGYLSTWLYNYVMSYMIREALAQHRVRRGKRIRCVAAVISYADDTVLLGRHSNLIRATRAMERWARAHGLELKSCWQWVRLSSFEGERDNHAARRSGSKRRTPGIDMMGFVVRRGYTIIRRRIWRRIRRQLMRAMRELTRSGYVPWWRAKRMSGYFGYFDRTNTADAAERYSVREIKDAASASEGWHERRRYYASNLHGAA